MAQTIIKKIKRFFRKKKSTRGIETNESRTWWAAARVRAYKTMAQTAISTIGTTAYIDGINWKLVISSSLLAGLLSILTSVKGLPEVDGS